MDRLILTRKLSFHAAVAFSLSLGALGCPEVQPPPPPAKTCTKLFEKCQLPSGPLGVCEQKSMSDDALVCRGQH